LGSKVAAQLRTGAGVESVRHLRPGSVAKMGGTALFWTGKTGPTNFVALCGGPTPNGKGYALSRDVVF